MLRKLDSIKIDEIHEVSRCPISGAWVDSHDAPGVVDMAHQRLVPVIAHLCPVFGKAAQKREDFFCQCLLYGNTLHGEGFASLVRQSIDQIAELML